MSDSSAWGSYFWRRASGFRKWGSPFLAIAGFIIQLAVKGYARQPNSKASPFSSSSKTSSGVVDSSAILIVASETMHKGGIGLGIASSTADGAKQNGSLRLKYRIVLKPHVNSINTEVEESPEPKYLPEKCRISPLDPPEIELLDAEQDKGKVPLEQPKSEPCTKTDPPCTCLRKKKLDTKKHPPNVSANDVMLSEYYTCTTTHGLSPNPTHMIGDMILESNSDKTIPGAFELSETPHPEEAADGFMNFCFCCSNKLQQGKEVFFCRDKTFCSFQCQCMEILSCGLGDDFNRSLLEQAESNKDRFLSSCPS